MKELFSKGQKLFHEIANEEAFENAKIKADAKKLVRVKISEKLNNNDHKLENLVMCVESVSYLQI